MSKKTKIKIKRSKVNLYNKKKSKAKHIIAIIITIVAACALCVLGYGIGKPLMDFFSKRGESSSSSSAWTPGGTVNPIVSSSSSKAPTESSSAGENEPLPKPEKTAYFLSDKAALSLESLNAELTAAKSSGFSTVVVTLKDPDGVFLYNSSIKRVKKTGTLTAEQIVAEIEKAGFVPAAKISTIKDKSNGVTFNCHYKFANGGVWLDNRPGVGKTWISPFDEKA